MPEPSTEPIRAGFCAIVGLPNVGKSTLLNRILGRHLVAVSAKPQTTRDRILGVHTLELPGQSPARAQIAYVDTPGVQDGRGPLRRYMRDAATAAASDADLTLLLVDGLDRKGRIPARFTEPDSASLAEALGAQKPLVVAINKVDRLPKPDLLPVIEAWAGWRHGLDVVPISAQTGDGVDELERIIADKLPVGAALFPEEMVTDRSPKFIAQEIIREQLYHQLGKELPYACAVQIESWSETPKKELLIGAVIVVERESQKPIVIGKGGNRIRELGIAARQAVGAALGKTVHLTLFVKVLAEWSRAERDLRRLGYGGEGEST
ncbi:MAG: GTPase Era [Kofleriaceae bacterium]